MGNLADAMSKVEEFERRNEEVPAAEILGVLDAVKEGGEMLPAEFGRLIEFVGDQAARWHARWQLSPAAAPDEDAKREARSWEGLWERWSELLCEGVPAARTPTREVHRLAFLRRFLEKREGGLRQGRVREAVVGLASRFAIFLDRINLRFIAVPLYHWALYPAGTVGRAGHTLAPTPEEESAEREVKEKANHLLALAATHGDVVAARAAVEKFGADVNARGKTGATPLMGAAANGKDEAIRYLLTRRANVSLRDEIGGTALHYACMRGAPTTAALLIEAGANPQALDHKGHTCVFDTVHLENIPVLEWFLANGADREARGDDGCTMLVRAAALGSLKVMDVLLRTGANVEARDLAGQTPLLTSLSHSHAEAARLLLDRGANPNAVDGSGRTALHHAAFGGLVGLCRRLLELGADPNAREADGETPLHVAARRGFPTIQTMLMDVGADTRMKTTAGKSLSDLEQEGAPARRVTEEIRLMRALPALISAEDMRRLAELMERPAPSTEEEAEKSWNERRFFLDDLAHAYRKDPSRADENPLPLDKVIQEAAKIHPGETP